MKPKRNILWSVPVIGLCLALAMPTMAQNCVQIKHQCAQQKDKQGQMCKYYRTQCGSVKYQSFAYGGTPASNLMGPNGSKLVRIDLYKKNCPQSPEDIFHIKRSYYRQTSPYGGDSYYTWDGDQDEYKIWTDSGTSDGYYVSTIGLPAGRNGWIAKEYTQGLSASEEAEAVKRLEEINVPANFQPCATNDDGLRLRPKIEIRPLPPRPSRPSDGCIYGQC